MYIHKISENFLDENSFLVGDEESKECVIIDPAEQADDFIKLVEKDGWKLKHILLTHAHYDHTSGIKKLVENPSTSLRSAQEITILMHKDELDSVKAGRGFIGEYSQNDFLDLPIKTIKDSEIIKISGLQIKVIHTPGHTQGSVCYLINQKHLFSGDTLFKNSIGRTDLYGGDYKEEIESIKNKLMTLSDDVAVYCGHGFNTTIGKEKTNFI